MDAHSENWDGNPGGYRAEPLFPNAALPGTRKRPVRAISHAHNLLKSVVSEQQNYYDQIQHLQDQMTPQGFDQQRRNFGASAAAGRVGEQRMLASEPVEVSKPSSLRKWPAAKAIPWLADPWISDSHHVVAVRVTPDDEVGPVWRARDGSEDMEVNSQ